MASYSISSCVQSCSEWDVMFSNCQFDTNGETMSMCACTGGPAGMPLYYSELINGCTVCDQDGLGRQTKNVYEELAVVCDIYISQGARLADSAYSSTSTPILLSQFTTSLLPQLRGLVSGSSESSSASQSAASIATSITAVQASASATSSASASAAPTSSSAPGSSVLAGAASTAAAAASTSAMASTSAAPAATTSATHATSPSAAASATPVSTITKNGVDSIQTNGINIPSLALALFCAYAAQRLWR